MSLLQSAAVASAPPPAQPQSLRAIEVHPASSANREAAPRMDLQLSHLFELSPDLLALGSSKLTTWLRVNPAFQKLLGWTESELIGCPVLEIVHAGDHDRVVAAALSMQQSSATDLDIRLLCKGGGYRWIALRLSPEEESGSLLLTGRDVTQSKRTLKNLRSAGARMQRENENLEQFVRTAGHDLQEPLRTLSMYSELLMRRYGADMPEASVELLCQIFGAAGRMQTLVRDLLVYAQISQDTEEGSSQFKDLALESVFTEALKCLRSSIEECSAIITHEPLPEVYGNDIQLAQLFQNLIGNSLKYRCPDGSVNIHVGAQKLCGECEFQISDDGRGFDPKHAGNIFLDFKRLHGHEIPGTGLGLSICRRIVQRHGGRIWAEGQPGKAPLSGLRFRRANLGPYKLYLKHFSAKIGR